MGKLGKKMETNKLNNPPMGKTLVIVFSYHHNNTEKIAHVVANVLGAEVKTPQQVKPEEIAKYDLVGFGSGIYGARNHQSIIDLAGRLPYVDGKMAFIFSTYGAPTGLYKGERLSEFTRNNHLALRDKLQAGGYKIIGEFSCAGWNTNSFLKYFGGLNKGKPDAEDIRNADAFAQIIKQKTR